MTHSRSGVTPPTSDDPSDQLVDPGGITVGPRHRKALGDLAGLRESIRELGQLYPVLVTPGLDLIDGQRRLTACQELGRPVRVAVCPDLATVERRVKAERDSNLHRLPLTPSELVAFAATLEVHEAREAAARQKATRIVDGRPGGEDSSPPAKRGKTREIVARAAGASFDTIRKAREVTEAAEADPEEYGDLIAMMDESGKVTPAWKELQRRKKLNAQPIKPVVLTAPPPSKWAADVAAELVGPIRMFKVLGHVVATKRPEMDPARGQRLAAAVAAAQAAIATVRDLLAAEGRA